MDGEWKGVERRGGEGRGERREEGADESGWSRVTLGHLGVTFRDLLLHGNSFVWHFPLIATGGRQLLSDKEETDRPSDSRFVVFCDIGKSVENLGTFLKILF